MKTKDWSLISVLKQSWSLTKENLIVVWGLLFLLVVISFVFDLLGGAEYSVRFWIFWAIQLLMSAWLTGGMYKALLNMNDEGEASFSVFKELLPRIGNLFLLSLLSSIIIYAPVLVAVLIQSLFVSVDWSLLAMTDINAIATLPGLLFAGYWSILWFVAMLSVLYLSIRFLFAVYVFVDYPEVGVVDALRRSWQLTQGNVGKLLLAMLVVIVINAIGLFALIIGIFVSLVTSLFVLTVLYRQFDKAMSASESLVDEVDIVSDKL